MEEPLHQGGACPNPINSPQFLTCLPEPQKSHLNDERTEARFRSARKTNELAIRLQLTWDYPEL